MSRTVYTQQKYLGCAPCGCIVILIACAIFAVLIVGAGS